MVKATRYLDCSPTHDFIHYYTKIKYRLFICMNIFMENWQLTRCFLKGLFFIAMSIWRVTARLHQPSLSGTSHQTTNSTWLFTCCLSNATKNDPTVQSQLRSIDPARQQPPTAVWPPTTQYQDINYWKFLSIQTVAHGNIFIRPNYGQRIYDHKLALTILFAAVSLYSDWHHFWPKTHRPLR